MASLSKSIAVKPFLMKTVTESHLIDDDASSQNGGAGKQVPSSPKTKKTSDTRVPNQMLSQQKHLNHYSNITRGQLGLWNSEILG